MGWTGLSRRPGSSACSGLGQFRWCLLAGSVSPPCAWRGRRAGPEHRVAIWDQFCLASGVAMLCSGARSSSGPRSTPALPTHRPHRRTFIMAGWRKRWRAQEDPASGDTTAPLPAGRSGAVTAPKLFPEDLCNMLLLRNLGGLRQPGLETLPPQFSGAGVPAAVAEQGTTGVLGGVGQVMTHRHLATPMQADA